MYKFLMVALLSIFVNGCSIIDPWIYKLSIQQGNITEFKQVDKLEIGMTKEQVRFVLGTPMATNSFDQDRWDYVYTYAPARGDDVRNNLIVYFVDNKLSKIEGGALHKKPPVEEPDEEL